MTKRASVGRQIKNKLIERHGYRNVFVSQYRKHGNDTEILLSVDVRASVGDDLLTVKWQTEELVKECGWTDDFLVNIRFSY